MKKSLLLAALLLPCAAQADVYFCSTSSAVYVGAKPSELSGKSIFSEQPNGADSYSNFVIDTRKGFRRASQDNSTYQGSCEATDEGVYGIRVACTRLDVYHFQNIFIKEYPETDQEIYFTEAEHLFGSNVSSSAGKCTKA